MFNPGFRYRYSASPADRSNFSAADRRAQRAQSQDRLLTAEAEGGNANDRDFGLSSKSALNGRYFEEKSGAKSRSLDNLLDNEVKCKRNVACKTWYLMWRLRCRRASSA